MKAADIYHILKTSLSHEYVLTNTYIFRWESDLFAISKGGLIHEVEVKMSRGDFKADFKKIQKHKELEMAAAGKKMFTVRHGQKFSYEFTDYSKRKSRRATQVKDFTPDKRFENVQLEHSIISFKKIFTPNRFYYACPEGLIKKDEVPGYAGLYWITSRGELIKKKQAPILHRSKPDIKAILLHKFYHLSLNLEIDNAALKRDNKMLRDFKGDIMSIAEDQPMQTEFDF